MQSFDSIFPKNRQFLDAKIQQLAQQRSMGNSRPVTIDDSSNAFERNRAYVRSGIGWLVKEGVFWARKRDWVEIVRNEEGDPIDLKVLADDS